MNVAFRLLLPLSWLYAAAVWLRNKCYDKGILAAHRVTVPVISVGNSTVGGTGKTPFVETIIEILLTKNKKIGIVSRGYKRTSTGTVVVSDGCALLANAEASGDEPMQIAMKFPGTVVIVDEERFRGATLAVEKFGAEVIVLDDGFQHRSLHRDLDIVMASPIRSWRDNQMLPAGYMREPVSSLTRADVVVSTVAGAGEKFVPASQPVIRVQRKVKEIRSLADGVPVSIGEFAGKQSLAFCGIGNPASFRNSLEELGVEVKEFLSFPDHYSYTAGDLAEIERRMRNNSLSYVFTTEKDAVRLQSIMESSRWLKEHCHYLTIELNITAGAELFNTRIDNLFRKAV